MALTERKGLERILTDIKLFIICRKLSAAELAELGWLCRHFTFSWEHPGVPVTMLARTTMDEYLLLRDLLTDQDKREQVLEAVELEEHHRQEPATK